MSEYKYSHFKVCCLEPREFPIRRMREAVEYLREQEPQTKYVGLSAVTSYRSKEYGFRLQASPMLTLDQIIGRTPKQLWEMFDADVTRQIKYFEQRMSRD